MVLKDGPEPELLEGDPGQRVDVTKADGRVDRPLQVRSIVAIGATTDTQGGRRPPSHEVENEPPGASNRKKVGRQKRTVAIPFSLLPAGSGHTPQKVLQCRPPCP